MISSGAMNSLWQRRQGQNRRRRIAARGWRRARLFNLVAEELGQAVRRRRQAIRILVRNVVPLIEDRRVVETIVGAEVDHFHAQVEEFRRDCSGRRMRQAAEDCVDAARFQLLRTEIFTTNGVLSSQRRVDFTDAACVFSTGNGDDFRRRMPTQQLEQFKRRVSGRAKDCDFNCVCHS